MVPVVAPTAPPPASEVPSGAEKFTYDIEWRLIHAGTAVVEVRERQASMKLESAGLVSTLYKIDDTYNANFDQPFCVTSTGMEAKEGKRHHQTDVTYDRAQLRATRTERDLIANKVLHSDSVEIPGCVHEIVGAIAMLRRTNLNVGQSTQIPLSDGRKSALVKVEAQEREDVRTTIGNYHTIRYEANMLNGVVYSRKGRVFIWLTDDARKLPVQIRVRVAFPVGSVTLGLAREEYP